MATARLLAVAAVTEKCIDATYAACLAAATAMPSAAAFLRRHTKSDGCDDTYATAETLDALANELSLSCVLCTEKGAKAVPQIVGLENKKQKKKKQKKKKNQKKATGGTAILFVSRREHISPVFVSHKGQGCAAPAAFDFTTLGNMLEAKLSLLASEAQALPPSTRGFVEGMIGEIRAAAAR